MNKSTIAISKFLSFVLRHDPASIGLRLDAQGWVDIDTLLAAAARKGRRISRQDLDHVVATNDKKRFTISSDGRSIRAAQGHSVSVDLALPAIEPPPRLYHGTATRFEASIMIEGLRPQSRRQVHLSADIRTATAVGARHGHPLVLIVDAVGMHRDGHVFNRADNGVWLTDSVPTRYLSRA